MEAASVSAEKENKDPFQFCKISHLKDRKTQAPEASKRASEDKPEGMFTWVGELRHLQSLGKVGGGVIEFQQLEKLQLRPCPLQAGTEAVGQSGQQGPQSLNQQHGHHLVGVLENLQRDRGIGVSTQGQRGAHLLKKQSLGLLSEESLQQLESDLVKSFKPQLILIPNVSKLRRPSKRQNLQPVQNNWLLHVYHWPQVPLSPSVTQSIEMATQNWPARTVWITVQKRRRWEVGNKMELKKSNSLSQGWRTSSQICRAAHSHLSP